MNMRTIEFDFEYQMKKVFEEMRSYNDLKYLDSEKFQDTLWGEYAEVFAHKVFEMCFEFSGDELFEK